jgi:hypothetical protein
MATSTKTHDYMGRALINASPGVTNPVRDYIGRNTTSTADYAGVLLLDDPAGSIAGVITDSGDDSPIEGATVTAGGRSATTNSDGEYTLTALQPAMYAISVSADGYDDATLEGVDVGFGEDVADVDIELDASS